MTIMSNCIRLYFVSQILLLSILHLTESTVYLSDHCGKTITLHGDRIRSHKGALQPYPRDLDCRLLLKTPRSLYKIQLNFEWFELPSESGGPDDPPTCKDYLEVYDSDDLHYSHRKLRRCRDSTPSHVTSTGDVILLRFVTDGEQTEEDTGFLITFTSFSPSGISDLCLNVNDFYCEQQFCIDKSLTCDCKSNCGDNSDEKYCATCKADVVYSSGLSTGAIVGIVLGVILLLALVVVVIYIMYRKQIIKAKSKSVVPAATNHQTTSTSHGAVPGAKP